MSEALALSIVEKLRAAGVDLSGPKARFDYRLLPPDAAARRDPRPTQPLVSCLMVTRGELGLMRHALACYAAQTWVRRELVVVTDAHRAEAVGELLRDLAVPDARVFGAPAGLVLGDLRNLAVARARGEVLMQWDDDDLSDPQRIAASVSVLVQTGAAAVAMARWMIWWPKRQVAAVSYPRVWEGSIALWRDQARVFPALARGEDGPPSQALEDHHPVAVIDDPGLYVYVITGRNTFDEAHFDRFIAGADCLFEGEDYQAVLDLLAKRLPIRDYQAFLMAT